MADALAECVPGHWESDVGAKLAAEYADKRRSDLAMAQLPDFALANAQFECSRFDLSLIGYQTAARMAAPS